MPPQHDRDVSRRSDDRETAPAAAPEPVGVSLVRPRVAAFSGDGPPPLSVYRSATEVGAPPDGPLSAGERRAVPVDAAGDAAFATLTLTLPDSAPPEGFLVARR